MRYAIPFVVCALIITVASDAAAQSYTVHPLLQAQFHPFFDQEEINNALQVVKYGDRRIWDRSPQPRGLPIPAGEITRVHINNAGIIAGARELGPGRAELFTIENGQYIPRPVPIANPYISEFTDSGIILAQDQTTETSWIIQGSSVQQLEERAFEMNDAGALISWKYIWFPSGRRVEAWPESAPIRVIGPSGHVAGGQCDATGCTVLYARPDLVTARYRFGLGLNSIFSMDLNRAGELVATVEQNLIFSRRVANFVYRDGPIIDLNAVMIPRGWLVCDTRGITDQGAILATAMSEERLRFGLGCQLVVLYPDPPAAPENFVANVSGRVVGLNWHSGDDVRDHIIEVGSAPGASNLLRMSIGPKQSVASPAPPGRYYVRLRAVNGVATSAPSAEVVVDVP